MSEDAGSKAEEEAEALEEGVVEKGDFILVELTGRVEETGEVFETTDEETARKAGIYDEGRIYEPRVIVVGEGWVLKGLDEGLVGLKVGEEAKVEVQPEDAFGERDPEKIRMVPYRILRSRGITPRVGAQVEFEGRTATVRSIGAGRVQLDYNHPLAGRKLLYEVKVLKRFETEEEKIRALIQRRVAGIDPKRFGLKIMKRKVRIEVPEEVLYSENLQFVKRGIALDIMRFFPNIREVSFQEVFKRESPRRE
ncbi:peptidylprolyl isomerase [Candidatus Bathyarchaeota archaeon]|nr:MAG: peptidylprolyl isomerase [Candidatus Bathyarchaeota archaeon]